MAYRISAFVSSLVMFLLVIASTGLARSQDRLIVAADIRCPFSCSALQTLPGYTVEVLRAIYEPLGITVDYRVISAVKAIELAERNEIDAVIGIRPEMAPRLRVPAYEIGMISQAYVMRKGAKWRYDGIESLRKITLGMPYNYYINYEFGKYIEANKFNRKRIIFGGGGDPVLDNLRFILRNRVDIAINDKTVLGYNIRKNKFQEQLEVVDVLGKPQPIYVAFRPQINPQIIKSFDAGMQLFSLTPKFQRILWRYGVAPWKCKNCRVQIAKN